MSDGYRSPVEIIAEGVEACWLNALDLQSAAEHLKDRGQHAIALSLCVLALEEVGKIYLLDGLLFARPGDERSKLFERGFRSHEKKLLLLNMFPILLLYFSRFNPHFRSEPELQQKLDTTVQLYKEERQALAPWLGSESSLTALDMWKQHGFYTHFNETGRVVRPTEITEEFSAAVFRFTSRIVDGVNFVLKDGIKSYKEWVLSQRENMSFEEVLRIRGIVQQILEDVISETESDSPTEDSGE